MKKKIFSIIAIILVLLSVLICLLILKDNQNKSEEALKNDTIQVENVNSTNNNIENNIKVNKENDNMKVEENNPVKEHGKLKVEESKLVDEKGNNVQLRGISTHGIKWFPEYINKESFKYMKDEWNINLVRLAIYSEDYDESQNKIIEDGINYTTELGMYVIIDWHTLNDNNPNTNKEKAKKFFTYIANKYKNNVNIIYEICNEPNGNVTWQNDIKPYAEEMINLIREINEDAVILCGTPRYCQLIGEVAKSPIVGQKNIMYTFHFYAATHKEDLREELKKGLESNLPIFVSEFGISEANGNNNINIEEANKWIDLLNKNNISFVYWNLSNKNEATALLKDTTKKTSDWSMEELSDAGKWYINIVKNK